jgi:hypothetical protein
MIGKRKLAVVVSATVIGGAGLTLALSVGAAHAQPIATISTTSAVAANSNESGNNPPQGGNLAELTFSVACPAGDAGVVQATASEGGAGTGSSSRFTCTGSAQSVSATASSSSASNVADFAAGQVFVGAALDITPPGTAGGAWGFAAGTASIVPITQIAN